MTAALGVFDGTLIYCDIGAQATESAKKMLTICISQISQLVLCAAGIVEAAEGAPVNDVPGSGLVPDGYRPRVVDLEVERGLRSAGFLVLEGPRGCGKTWTGLRHARSVIRLDIDLDARTLGSIDPSTLLSGETPRLIDEWQVVPQLWNHVRHAVDAASELGRFILVGSARPADDSTRHTGAGRVRRIRMRPMSLYESGDSTGEVSLGALLDGRPASAARPDSGLAQVTQMLCRGGWPGQAELPLPEIQRNLRGYLTEAARTDVRLLDDAAIPSPAGVERLLRSLARNVATEASMSTLGADTEPAPLHRHTVRAYLEALRRVFVVEEQPAWSVRLRSRAPLRKSAKWHLADPSLAAAALGANAERLMGDMSTLGLLFESLVVRDLRILAQPYDGRVAHLRDAAGTEADAIVELPDGRWLAAEIKLGGSDAIETAAQTLRRARDNVAADRAKQLVGMVVVTALGFAYTRPDGIRVTPITALGP